MLFLFLAYPQCAIKLGNLVTEGSHEKWKSETTVSIVDRGS